MTSPLDSFNFGEEVTIEQFEDSSAKLAGELSSTSEKIGFLEERVRMLQEIRDVLTRLPKRWKERDPGKYGIAYSFLADGERSLEALQTVVVRELLPDGTRIFTEENYPEWKKYIHGLGSHLLLDVVSPYKRVVKFSDVARRTCPECSREQPVIQSYHQTYDSPEGDSWEKVWFVICDGRIHTLHRKGSESRF